MNNMHSEIRIPSDWCGVQNKLTLMIYLMIIFSMTTVAYYGYQSARTAYHEKALAVISHGVRDTGQVIKEFLHAVPDDLAFVSSFYAMKRYLYWRDLDVDYKTSEWKNAALETFRSFLLSKDHYYKLRFIDNKGFERISIRYNRKTGKVFTELPKNLQDRRHSKYFLEPMKIGAGEIFVSAMNLNEEYGKIEKPYVPVLRFARPVIGDNNVRYGVAVLNVYAETFLERIGRNIEEGRSRYLISATGNYFFHPNGKAWGHLMGDQTGFHKDFPEVFAQLQGKERGAFSLDRRMICFERIYPHPQDPDNFWILIDIMDKDTAIHQVDKFVRFFIFIFLATVLLVFVSTRYFIGGLMRPLLVVTRQLQYLGRGEIVREASAYTADDEISMMLESAASLVCYMEDLSMQADRIAAGNYTESVSILSEQDRLGNAINNMTLRLKTNAQENEQQHWLTDGKAQLDDLLRGEQSVDEMTDRIITFLASYLQAAVGTFYLSDDDAFRLHASYAYRNRKNSTNVFRPGEGMVGQAALGKKIIIVNRVPDDYIAIRSGLGKKTPSSLLIAPFLYNDKVKAVLELGSFTEFDELQIQFIKQIGNRIGLSLTSAQSRLRMREILQITRQQAAELQNRQDKLKATNEELEGQTLRLRTSEEELQTKQDQLAATNEMLEEKNRSLSQQKEKIEKANRELLFSRMEIERKVEEVAESGRYKSEFLANMSHELRTPLNSLLLLAQTLEQNKQGNLTEDDLESIRVIHNSSNELLSLINDILDLSKIEARKMDLILSPVSLADLLEDLKSGFQHLAEKKGLTLEFTSVPEVPEIIQSDRQRLVQVLKNLISNALKFTEQGTVTVTASPADPKTELRNVQPADSIAIAVRDSGVGIPPDKQKIIFEAFQQADGGTSRKYGGTGLGLSISRELAELLGGEIHLQSEEGRGSTFTLYLPLSQQKRKKEEQQKKLNKTSDQGDPTPTAVVRIADDRNSLEEDDRIVLVIEDDLNFADLLLRQCHENDLKCLAAPTGNEGLELVASHPPMAIILDLNLPDISGWKVLASLKEQTGTRHIPVHIISADDAEIDARRRGAVKALRKPVSMEKLEQAFRAISGIPDQRIKTLLVAGRDAGRKKAIITLVGNNDVRSEEAGSGQEVMERLRLGLCDCLIMSLNFPDMTGFKLLSKLEAENVNLPPIIVYTGRKLSREETEELRRHAKSIIVRGVMSEDRLLDESALFLHRMISEMPERKQRMIRNLHEDDALFQGKRVLLVDDDMRNMFALAKVLQDKGMETVKAEDGLKALAALKQEQIFDLVLMDIMMPIMDGYETIQKIRQQPKFKDLPIIALTAKAMKEDRGRCLAAGANDYLAKPVDMERLVALLRLWLYR